MRKTTGGIEKGMEEGEGGVREGVIVWPRRRGGGGGVSLGMEWRPSECLGFVWR